MKINLPIIVGMESGIDPEYLDDSVAQEILNMRFENGRLVIENTSTTLSDDFGFFGDYLEVNPPVLARIWKPNYLPTGTTKDYLWVLCFGTGTSYRVYVMAYLYDSDTAKWKWMSLTTDENDVRCPVFVMTQKPEIAETHYGLVLVDGMEGGNAKYLEMNYNKELIYGNIGVPKPARRPDISEVWQNDSDGIVGTGVAQGFNTFYAYTLRTKDGGEGNPSPIEYSTMTNTLRKSVETGLFEGYKYKIELEHLSVETLDEGNTQEIIGINLYRAVIPYTEGSVPLSNFELCGQFSIGGTIYDTNPSKGVEISYEKDTASSADLVAYTGGIVFLGNTKATMTQFEGYDVIFKIALYNPNSANYVGKGFHLEFVNEDFKDPETGEFLINLTDGEDDCILELIADSDYRRIIPNLMNGLRFIWTDGVTMLPCNYRALKGTDTLYCDVRLPYVPAGGTVEFYLCLSWTPDKVIPSYHNTFKSGKFCATEWEWNSQEVWKANDVKSDRTVFQSWDELLEHTWTEGDGFLNRANLEETVETNNDYLVFSDGGGVPELGSVYPCWLDIIPSSGMRYLQYLSGADYPTIAYKYWGIAEGEDHSYRTVAKYSTELGGKGVLRYYLKIKSGDSEMTVLDDGFISSICGISDSSVLDGDAVKLHLKKVNAQNYQVRLGRDGDTTPTWTNILTSLTGINELSFQIVFSWDKELDTVNCYIENYSVSRGYVALTYSETGCLDFDNFYIFLKKWAREEDLYSGGNIYEGVSKVEVITGITPKWTTGDSDEKRILLNLVSWKPLCIEGAYTWEIEKFTNGTQTKEGMIRFSDPGGRNFPDLNYLFAKGRLRHMEALPMYLSTGIQNTLLLFGEGIRQRFLLSGQPAEWTANISENMIEDLSQWSLVGRVIKRIGGDAIYLTPNGLVRENSEGREIISKKNGSEAIPIDLAKSYKLQSVPIRNEIILFNSSEAYCYNLMEKTWRKIDKLTTYQDGDVIGGSTIEGNSLNYFITTGITLNKYPGTTAGTTSKIITKKYKLDRRIASVKINGEAVTGGVISFKVRCYNQQYYGGVRETSYTNYAPGSRKVMMKDNRAEYVQFEISNLKVFRGIEVEVG